MFKCRGSNADDDIGQIFRQIPGIMTTIAGANGIIRFQNKFIPSLGINIRVATSAMPAIKRMTCALRHNDKYGIVLFGSDDDIIKYSHFVLRKNVINVR